MDILTGVRHMRPDETRTGDETMTTAKIQAAGTKLAKRQQFLAKLQAFADTLDINEARVEIGSGSWDMAVVWLKWRPIGSDRVRSAACGLVEHGIRYVTKQMKDVEASLL